jgi:hypothetical protein
MIAIRLSNRLQKEQVERFLIPRLAKINYTRVLGRPSVRSNPVSGELSYVFIEVHRDEVDTTHKAVGSFLSENNSFFCSRTIYCTFHQFCEAIHSPHIMEGKHKTVHLFGPWNPRLPHCRKFGDTDWKSRCRRFS